MAESLVRKKCSVLIWLLLGKGERNMTHIVYLLCAELSRILLNLTEPYEGDTLLLPPRHHHQHHHLYYYHFIGEETEVQRGEVTYLRSHSP